MHPKYGASPPHKIGEMPTQDVPLINKNGFPSKKNASNSRLVLFSRCCNDNFRQEISASPRDKSQKTDTRPVNLAAFLGSEHFDLIACETTGSE